QRVEGPDRQVADLRPLAVQRRQERHGGQQQREREVPDRDVAPPPPVQDPAEVDHRGSVAAASVRSPRRIGTTLPRRRASHMNATVSSRPNTTAYRLPSGPNAPPVSRVGPDVAASSSPWALFWPETSVLKMPTAAKFHPKCRPMGSQRVRVAA